MKNRDVIWGPKTDRVGTLLGEEISRNQENKTPYCRYEKIFERLYYLIREVIKYVLKRS